MTDTPDHGSTAPFTLPQFGIFAQGTHAHHFLEFDLKPGVSAVGAVSAFREQPAFTYHGGRDITGFIDGTANPQVLYGTAREHGLYFVAFSAERSRYGRMLARIFGNTPDDLRDRLTDFSRPVSGGYYFAPSLNALNELAGKD